MLCTTPGEFAILWKVRAEYGAEAKRPGIRPGGDMAAASGRTRLPAVRWSLSPQYSFLRQVRHEHGLTSELTTFQRALIMFRTEIRSLFPENRE